jgi:hypothetical protein
MLNDNKTLDAVMNRYKLGIDFVQASREFEKPDLYRPSWRDRFFFNLGKRLVVLGSRLQQRHSSATPAVYHPAYPAS